MAARAAGAWARSVVEPLGLARKEHEAAVALQHWRPDHLDEGDGGSVSRAGAMAAGRWQVGVISWSPAKLLMFIRAFNLFETQWLYRSRKSAVADAVVSAVAAGGNELEPVLFRTTSAQEGVLDMGLRCYFAVHAAVTVMGTQPAKRIRPLSVSGGAEPCEGPD